MSLWTDAQRVANFGTWEWQVEAGEMVWSEQLHEIFGVGPGHEPSFDAYTALIHPGDRDRVMAAIESALAGLRPYRFEHEVIRPDGTVRLVRCYGEPIRDDEGNVSRVVGVCQDVTDLHDRASGSSIDERFRSAFEHAPTGVALVELAADGGAKFTEVNRALAEIAGRNAGELVGAELESLLDESDHQADRQLNVRLVAGEIDRYTVERQGRRSNGSPKWLFIGMSVVRDTAGEITQGVAQVQDITERKEFEDQLRYVADHDSLTGIFNRRRFRTELEAELARSKRYGCAGVVLVVDVDGLKAVNDRDGHPAGDLLLRRLADTLRKRVRSTDVVARLGGDEFALMLPETPRNEAEQLAAELIDRLGAAGEDGRELPISIGISAFGGPVDESASADQIIASADGAMYMVKKRGGRAVAVAGTVAPPPVVVAAPRARLTAVPSARDEEPTAPPAQAGRRLPDKVTAALESRRLMLFGQPVVDLRSGQIVHREVLLRMRELNGDVLSASGFLAAASQRPGLCAEVDRWVVGRVLELVAAEGLEQPVNINLSGETLANEVTLQGVIESVRASGITPGTVAFEVGEAAIGRDLARAESALGRLADTGCPLVLDGFRGTFGSYDYLQRLPLSQIKIEGSVVRALEGDPPDHSTMRAIVDVARQNSSRTVAKLVDSEAIVPLLRMHGVDMAQGFRFGLPAPLSEAGLS